MISVLLLSVIYGASSIPNGYNWGCLPGNVSASLPFCNYNLSINERIDDLISRLTLDEKLSFMGADTRMNDTGGVNYCTCMNHGVSRLGVANYLNLVEANSFLTGNCIGPNQCIINFAGPTGLAASFNKKAWFQQGDILSNELRALNNHNYNLDPSNYKVGLTGFGPNINIERDPRFGRNSELCGEDPYLSGVYATQRVQGMQIGSVPNKYFKMIAGLKHFAAYSVENQRYSRIFNISTFDLFDTYLRQYKMAFDSNHGNAQAVMCSYAGINGIPSCANDWLLNKVLRESWKRPDAYVASDCTAVKNLYLGNIEGGILKPGNHYADNETDAAYKAIKGGLDLEMGTGQFLTPLSDGGKGYLSQVISLGLINEERINESVKRSLDKRMKVGLFDPIEKQDFMKIGLNVINSTDTWKFVLDSTIETLVLLENNNNILPLSSPSFSSLSTGDSTSSSSSLSKLVILGPQAFAQRDLFEDYKGTECLDGSDTCVETISGFFTRSLSLNGFTVQSSKGVDVNSTDTSDIKSSLTLAQESDLIILVLGDGYTQEHEQVDRNEITLPGLQETFAQQVLALKKRTVIILINGGAISIPSLMNHPNTAIIEAFMPGMRGAEALYQTIFGFSNRFGRLPITIYNSSFIHEQDMYSFDMTSGFGRTYRYYNGNVLYPFGYGLSYTKFHNKCKLHYHHYTTTDERKEDKNGKPSSADEEEILLKCSIENVGQYVGDNILMIYHKFKKSRNSIIDHPIPKKSLIKFERVGSIPVKGKVYIEFTLSSEDLLLTNLKGKRIFYKDEEREGLHCLEINDGMTLQEVCLNLNKKHLRVNEKEEVTVS